MREQPRVSKILSTLLRRALWYEEKRSSVLRERSDGQVRLFQDAERRPVSKHIVYVKNGVLTMSVGITGLPPNTLDEVQMYADTGMRYST